MNRSWEDQYSSFDFTLKTDKNQNEISLNFSADSKYQISS
jgi:hypothetical protein